MKLALCLLATLLSSFSLFAQSPEERITFKRMPVSSQDHRFLLASNMAEDSKEEATQKTRGKKRITKAEAPQNGSKHIYKTIGEIDLPLYVFQTQQPQANDKRPAIVFFLAAAGPEEARFNLKSNANTSQNVVWWQLQLSIELHHDTR